MFTDIKNQKPDCIVHDSLNVLGKVIAAKTNTPAICYVPTFVLTPQLIFSSSAYLYPDYLKFISHPIQAIQMIMKYRSLYSRLKLQPPPIIDVFSNKEMLNVVFTSRFFQPDGENFDKGYTFVGPIIYNRNDQKDKLNLPNDDHPIIYISLGTVYNNKLEFYKKWISFFKNTSYQVYISIGKCIEKKDLGTVPKNIVVDDYLPQLEILKKSALFISHGGMNSVNESLYYGVPMVLFPQIQEQKINSARVEKLGAGIWYKQTELNEKSMTDMVNKLITNGSYKENALKLGKTLKDAGGIQKAVFSILNYLENKKVPKRSSVEFDKIRSSGIASLAQR